MHKLSLGFIAIFFSLYIYAQENLQHTLLYHDSIGSPQADLSQIKWIAGHWQGEAFGGITEEVWTPALGGSMMGAFKLVVDNYKAGEISMYIFHLKLIYYSD